MAEITGKCLCGAVAYSLSNKPSRTTICYCTFCQRATGSTQMILPVTSKDNFTVTRGNPQTHTHVSEGSGKELYLHFCDACGTKLFVTFERWPDNVGLYSGTLDDPAVVELTPENTKQIFVSSARPGTVLYPGIPAYRQHAVTLDGAPEEVFVLDSPTAVEDFPGG